ncbi:MAG TPA: thioredoxin domain-containing protein, partial [Terrimesophilobacter sp.]|nr:thioredoxin domain-containing protein [Terrimesophilobacter sp.]
RYATKRNWSEPHYERMLYDNAGLLRAAAFADDEHTASEVARFLLTVLRLDAPGRGGVFASAQDSESIIDGQRSEGGYFQRDAAGREGLTPPALDEKVITGWNGLAIEALVIAGCRLARPDLLNAARDAADWLLEHHVRADGSLVHASLGGVASESRATLADHGMLATALLALATATGEVRYAVAGRELVDATRTSDAGASHPPFTVEPDPVLAAQGLVIAGDPSEGDIPSGASAIARAAILLHALTGDLAYREAAERMLAPAAPLALSQPTAFGGALAVLGELASAPRQVVVVTGERRNDDVSATALRAYGEATITAVGTESQAAEWVSHGFELFESRAAQDGKATAYVCEAFTCRLPVTSAADLITAMRVLGRDAAV